MARRPLNGSPAISQAFGDNDFDYSPYGLIGHHGVDYAVGAGTPVYAPENGVIEKSSNGVIDKYTGRAAAGETIIMLGDTMEHWFMHLQTRKVSAGQRVTEGELLGYSDNTGVSTGNHLHWGTRPLNGPNLNNGYRGFTDPAKWLFAPQPAPVPVPTPPSSLKPNQRVLANKEGVNQRAEPTTNSAVIKEWPYDQEPFNFKGFVTGQDPYGKGNNVWFVGAISGGYFYSGAFVGGADTTGLPNLTPNPIPAPPQPPLPVEPPSFPEPTKDPLVTKVYNKKNPVGPDYTPTDLEDIGNSQKLRKEAAAALKKMQYDSANALVYGSGYRSYATQEKLYDQYVKEDGQAEADRYSARPGYSEHQTGLTLDFSPIDDNFKNTTAYKWLMTNAYKYGWILRYPEGKEAVTGYMPEPWHWRYVGVTVATDMHNKVVSTLEEYYNIPGGLYPDQEPKPSSKDDEQDKRLNRLEAVINAIIEFLAKVFSGELLKDIITKSKG